MGSKDNSSRLANNRMCKEIVKSPLSILELQQDFLAKLQKAQEDFMWTVYRDEQDRMRELEENFMWDAYFAEKEYQESSNEGNPFVVSPEFGNDLEAVISSNGLFHGKSTVFHDLHQYATKKNGHTSKDRRYIASTKKSDQAKIHGKLKGRSHRKLKLDGTPAVSIADIV